MSNSQVCEQQCHQLDPLDKFRITCHKDLVKYSDCTSQCYDISSEELSKNYNYEFALSCLDIGIEQNLRIEAMQNRIGEALRGLEQDIEAQNHYKNGWQVKKRTLIYYKLKVIFQKYQNDMMKLQNVRNKQKIWVKIVYHKIIVFNNLQSLENIIFKFKTNDLI